MTHRAFIGKRYPLKRLFFITFEIDAKTRQRLVKGTFPVPDWLVNIPLLLTHYTCCDSIVVTSTCKVTTEMHI